MSDENETRVATENGGGEAPGSSLLRDALEPAAKEMGRALETLAKAFNLALAPISVLAWSYDAMRETMARPMAGRMRKGLDSMGNLMEEMNTATVTGAAGKVIAAVSPALLPRKSASADLAYDPEVDTRELGTDEASLTVEANTAQVAYQFDFAVSTCQTYVIQTRGRDDLVLGLFYAEPPYRRITYKDDGGEGHNPLIRRQLEADTYFLVARRFGGERFEREFELSLAPEPDEPTKK